MTMITGSDTIAPDPAAQPTASEHGFRVPGVVAAATWALGLAAGLIALATGHTAVAIGALSGAIMSPWIGLAWMSHGQRQVVDSEPAPIAARCEVSLATDWRLLRPTSR
ncbi:hypothetical protein BST45_10790 [Mycobacterium shinjukuense]|nr:hypothetical protein BST45_10790 [Mycobacterium shinjukuense]